MFRFSNRFYPEMMGYGSLPDAMASWISNHINYSFYDLIGGAFSGFVGTFISMSLHQTYIDIAHDDSVGDVKKSVASGAIHTLLGMIHNDVDYVNDYLYTLEGGKLINRAEYHRLLANPVFNDPNYFNQVSHVMDFEVKYFDEVGPGGNIYEDWASDYHHAYFWGVLSSLNGYTEKYEKRTDIGIYDSYFLVDGSRYMYKENPTQTGISHNFKAVAELYALKKMNSN